MVDNGASASITPYFNDFISPPQPINIKVKGIGGHAQVTYKGTVQWKVLDDQGHSHRFTLPNSYFVAMAPSRILCPPHLAQTAKDNCPLPLGTGEITGDEYIQLSWNQHKYIKTIKLDPRRNIGMTHTAPGIHKFKDFVAQQAVQTPAHAALILMSSQIMMTKHCSSHRTQFNLKHKKFNHSFLCNKLDNLQ